MDQKALYQVSYGVYMLSTKAGDISNGCIINTCMQVANDPERIAISVLNRSYTCELIKQSSIFALSVLDRTCTYETIKHFGFQSGRNVPKFKEMKAAEDSQGSPYLTWQTCAVISAKVLTQYDLGTHTLFIAEITGAELLNDNPPLTYAEYQNQLKPKPEEPKRGQKIVGWRCKICDYVYQGSELPADYICPLCGHGADDFEPIYG